MLERISINEIFPDWDTGVGIFDYFSFRVPWYQDRYGLPSIHNSEYYGNYSCNKLASPLLRTLYHNDDDELSVESKERLANIIEAMYLRKWTKIWNTYNLEYNPLSNYKVSETGSETLNIGDVTSTSDSVSNSGSSSNEHNVFGYNTSSSTGVPYDKDASTENNTRTGSGTSNKTRNEHESVNKLKEGNIGTTSMQDLVRQERDVWRYLFFNEVYSDIDSILTLKIFK